MNNASDSIRAFLAFELPEETAAVLKQVQRCLIDQDIRVSWVRPENIHLTVKFLGEISSQAVERVCRAAAETAEKARPMDMTVKGLGVFPDARRPRVVWAGLSGGTQSLIDFQAELEENLEISGFAKEPRPFKAHLTLGRVKHAIPPGKLVSALDACSRFSSRQFSADRLVLFRSDLKPEGAVYTVVREFPLSGGEYA